MIDALGRSGGVILAWNVVDYDKLDRWKGPHVADWTECDARSGMIYGVVPAYGSTNPTICINFGQTLPNSKRFQDLPLTLGEGFNVMLEAENQPFGLGGQDWD